MFETISKHVFYIHYPIHIGQESNNGREIKKWAFTCTCTMGKFSLMRERGFQINENAAL